MILIAALLLLPTLAFPRGARAEDEVIESAPSARPAAAPARRPSAEEESNLSELDEIIESQKRAFHQERRQKQEETESPKKERKARKKRSSAGKTNAVGRAEGTVRDRTKSR
ncbi:MAG: hypothetical protein HY078_00480 [Elusimicrobia bacterium]|nr:hypothetical protein [Elusimicrobiota bacterium]